LDRWSVSAGHKERDGRHKEAMVNGTRPP
jgi:hypothetical protein